jgi:hypothetical protein
MFVESTTIHCVLQPANGALATTQGWPEFRQQQIEPTANGRYLQSGTDGRWIAFSATLNNQTRSCIGWETQARRVRGSGYICAPIGRTVDASRGEEFAKRAGRSPDLMPEVLTPLPTR